MLLRTSRQFRRQEGSAHTDGSPPQCLSSCLRGSFPFCDRGKRCHFPFWFKKRFLGTAEQVGPGNSGARLEPDDTWTKWVFLLCFSFSVCPSGRKEVKSGRLLFGFELN